MERLKLSFNNYRSTILKYLFSIILICYVYLCLHSERYFISSLVELFGIFCISNVILNYSKRVGYIVNSILLLLFNVQMAVLAFGNTYLSMIMLTNLKAIEMLSGKAHIYITAVILTIIFSFLPVSNIAISIKKNVAMIVITGVVFVLGLNFLGKQFSPFYNYYDLAFQWRSVISLNYEIKHAANDDTSSTTNPFYNEAIVDYIPKEDTLCEQPNIILIFTEGISKHIILDERNIMPNIRALQE